MTLMIICSWFPTRRGKKNNESLLPVLYCRSFIVDIFFFFFCASSLLHSGNVLLLILFFCEKYWSITIFHIVDLLHDILLLLFFFSIPGNWIQRKVVAKHFQYDTTYTHGKKRFSFFFSVQQTFLFFQVLWFCNLQNIILGSIKWYEHGFKSRFFIYYYFVSPRMMDSESSEWKVRLTWICVWSKYRYFSKYHSSEVAKISKYSVVVVNTVIS